MTIILMRQQPGSFNKKHHLLMQQNSASLDILVPDALAYQAA